ncbi:Rne/Rng family ribonuclease [Geoalkalibacter subterraneus]|uniref:Rne/Rng family ribonuclease n=1 Tax=Geoalkalibacter subterraneus TaxID=483547 RepID=UPI000693246E|nr:Rne/Rng family ribonuclease [Geoalkalibacter subterraneus]
MSRKMLINATHPEEHRVAIVEDGYLTELDIETTAKEQTRGNIYKAAVIRVESGLQAAFVDYGGERLGFLQISEIHPSLYPPSPGDDRRGRPRINDILRPGQEILVQVTKEERGTKGAALTTYLSLAGRYMVLMPESPTKGVSRKIEEESERKKLKKAMAELDLPENMGYIVRTAGIGKAPEELRRDFENLVEIHRGIQERARQAKAPCLIFRESNLIIRCIRDYFTEETEEVLIDDPVMYEAARDFFRMLMPDKVKLVKLHQERRPIFSRYQIEEQIETINHNKVNLPSGGSIVLDTTEALVAVDVNSGKMSSEQGIEATAYKTNLEAAEETARQLRLRDLAGLIVIDFIDMRDRKNIRAIEKKMRDALKKDKSRVTVGRISQFGLLEMSRQRLKPNLSAASYRVCPQCQGHGQIKSVETQGLAFLRRIQAASAAKGQLQRIEGRLPLEVADYLLNIKREELSEMERRYDMEIILHGQAGMLPHEAELNTIRREKEETSSENGDIAPINLVSQVDSVLNGGSNEKDEDRSGKESDAAPEEAAAPAAENASTEQAPKKRRRRRRRKKPSTSEATGTEAAQGPAEPVQMEKKEKEIAAEKEGEPATDQPAASTAPLVEKEPEAPPVPKRSTLQRTAQGEEAAQSEAKAETKEEPKTAPPRARAPRRRKPARPKSAESPSVQTNSAGEEPFADETAPKPPQKRPEAPREPAAAQSEQKQETQPEQTPEPEANASEAETQAAAPRKRRGRPRKTEAKKEQEQEKEKTEMSPAQGAPPQQGAAEGEARETEAKPAPRRRTTRKASTSTRVTARKAAEKAENAAEPSESPKKETSKGGEPEAEAAAKKATLPRTRRTPTTRKTPARTKATEKKAEAEPEPMPGKDASDKTSPTETASKTEKSTAAKKTPAEPRTRRTAARTTKTDKASQSESSPDKDQENSDQ